MTERKKRIAKPGEYQVDPWTVAVPWLDDRFAYLRNGEDEVVGWMDVILGFNRVIDTRPNAPAPEAND